MKFPDGTIFQWGINEAVNLSYPITFPHQCLSLIASREYSGPWPGYSYNSSAGIVDVKSYNNSGAVMTGGSSDPDGGAGFGVPGKYHWFAIGY